MMSTLYEDIVKFVSNNLKCSICFEIFTKPVTLVCGHNYCQKCINDHLKRARRDCPHCRAPVTTGKLKINVTLNAILEFQELGGRERWEQILTDTDKDGRNVTKVEILMKRLDWLKAEIKATEDKLSAELNSKQDCEDGFDNSDTVTSSPDVSSSPLACDASSCYGDRSSSSLASVNSWESSHFEEEYVEEGPNNSDSSFEDDYLARTTGAVGSDEATLYADFAELTFSPQLGNGRLIFHTERRTVKTQPGRQVRSSNNRFDKCQWMAEQEFTGGRFFWDVDTTSSTGWAVGVTYPNLKRDEMLGRTSSSWCLEWSSGQLRAWHNNIETSVKHCNPSGIRVMLDMANRQLYFQSLSENLLELHRFQVDFTAPVRPVFWLYGLSQNALSFPIPNF